MQDTYSTTMRSEALAKDWMDGDGITGSGGLQIGCREEPALDKQLETGMRVKKSSRALVKTRKPQKSHVKHRDQKPRKLLHSKEVTLSVSVPFFEQQAHLV